MPLDATGWNERPELQVLRRARSLIERPECWVKNGQVLDGQYCPERAVQVAAEEVAVEQSLSPPLLQVKALHHLLAVLPRPWLMVWLFNDYRGTTHADVLGLFDRAIARLAVPAAA